MVPSQEVGVFTLLGIFSMVYVWYSGFDHYHNWGYFQHLVGRKDGYHTFYKEKQSHIMKNYLQNTSCLPLQSHVCVLFSYSIIQPYQEVQFFLKVMGFHIFISWQRLFPLPVIICPTFQVFFFVSLF